MCEKLSGPWKHVVPPITRSQEDASKTASVHFVTTQNVYFLFGITEVCVCVCVCVRVCVYLCVCPRACKEAERSFCSTFLFDNIISSLADLAGRDRLGETLNTHTHTHSHTHMHTHTPTHTHSAMFSLKGQHRGWQLSELTQTLCMLQGTKPFDLHFRL